VRILQLIKDSKTRIVNLFAQGYDVYIGRPGKGEEGYFGNPVPLKNVKDEKERKENLIQYKKYFYARLQNDKEFKRRILELKGKTLGCFCVPKECHGNIIKEYLDNNT